MSNNNPHGHLNQSTDNPSWNPLQIPSYIPRQPQLAHMSNERPMVRSPLAWHAPPPPDSIYNFMSANHKNLDHQMNPLLPPTFVRGPSPFDSMDLSLQSSRGTGSAALTKASGMSAVQHEYGHQKHGQHQQQQQQQQQTQQQQHHTNQQQQHTNQHSHHQQQQQQNQQQQPHAVLHNANINYPPIHNLSTNPSVSLIHPQQQAHNIQHSNMPQSALVGMQCASTVLTSGSNATPKYMTSNGNECDTMLPPASVASNTAGSLTSGTAMASPVHYMRDTESNFPKLSHLKRNYEVNEPNSLHKPVELVNKECNYPPTMSSKMSTQQQQQHGTSKKPSPLRNFHGNTSHNQQHQHQQQQQHLSFGNTTPNKRNGPHTPPTPQSPIMHQPSPTMPTHSAQQHQMHTGVGTLVGMSHASSAGALDFNQLHLQQQQSTYSLSQATQQLVQHLEFASQHTHSQTQQQHHLMQSQQQQHSHQQPQHLLTAAHLVHSPQTPPHQQVQHQQVPNITTTRQPTQALRPPHSPMPQSQHPQRSPLSQFTKRNEEQSHEPSSLTELSSSAATATATAAYAYNESLRAKSNIPDAPDSPDMTTSNEESLDSNSNSNSSGSRLRRKRKNNNVVRLSSDTVVVPKAAQQNPPALPNTSENNSSPKSSPAVQRKSPRRSSYTSPSAIEQSPLALRTTPTSLLNQLSKAETSIAQENGRLPPANNPQKHDADREAETIEKIASMITKTNSNDNNSNSNFSHKSMELSIFESGSPKTKKQRQALKLRNAELLQTNSNGSTASSTFNEHSNPINDNAVQAADEVQKETVIKSLSTTPIPQRNSRQSTSGVEDLQSVSMERTLSPHSNSRSSSSSTSSSSCSHTTHSSNASVVKEEHKKEQDLNTKQEQLHKKENLSTPSINQIVKKEEEKVEKNDSVDDEKPVELTKTEETTIANIPKEEESPTKSCTFEEVENKLQEMFAGIEDEPAGSVVEEERTTPAAVNGIEIVKDLSLALEFSSNSKSNAKTDLITNTNSNMISNSNTKLNADIKAENAEATAAKTESIPIEELTDVDKLITLDKPEKSESLVKPQLELALTTVPTTTTIASTETKSDKTEEIKVERPIATKAAKKSTLPSPIKSKTPPPLTPEYPTKRLPPRRRLSVGMDPAFLRITIEPELKTRSNQRAKKSNEIIKETPMHLDDEKPTTSAAAAAAAAAVLVATTSNVDGKAKTSSMNKTTAAAQAIVSAPTTIKTNNVTAANRNKVKNSKATAKYVGAGNKKNKNAKKNTKQTHQKNKRNSSSSDDSDSLPLAVTRDNNATNAAAAAALAATITTTIGNNSTATEPKYKSPFVLVKKDGSISVINAPTAEDLNDKLIKKPIPSYPHDRKKIRGLLCSTLGKKYDAETIDSTWICVFCKRGPHKLGLGDLFGPYEVTINCDEYRTTIGQQDAIDVDAEFVSKRRRIDMMQTNPRNLPVVPATLAQTKLGMHKKKKKSMDDILELTTPPPASSNHDAPDIKIETETEQTFLGMCKNTDTTYEVWLHEDCLVWAPHVYLVGARITGLEAAVWNSLRHQCVVCGNNGAVVCCLQRDCKAPAHIPCARQAHWHLEEKSWHVHCQKHIPNDLLNTTTNISALHALSTTTLAYS